MPQKTHYQDDLFFLSLLARTLEAGLSVEADPEYFRERIEGDMRFIDGNLRSFGQMLAQSSHLIDRIEYLKLLERTSRTFTACLQKLRDGAYPNAAVYGGDRDSLNGLISGQRALLSELEKALSMSGQGESETDLVSSDELSELLRGG